MRRPCACIVPSDNELCKKQDIIDVSSHVQHNNLLIRCTVAYKSHLYRMMSQQEGY